MGGGEDRISVSFQSIMKCIAVGITGLLLTVVFELMLGQVVDDWATRLMLHWQESDALGWQVMLVLSVEPPRWFMELIIFVGIVWKVFPHLSTIWDKD